MLYALHEAAFAAAAPVHAVAHAARSFWGSPLNPAADSGVGRNLYAMSDVLTHMTRRYGKPEWRIDAVEIGGSLVGVDIETVWSGAFGRLLHFKRDADQLAAAGQPSAPAVVLVAPLSGHYATLLRGTVQTFLKDHDVYIAEWTNARDVPLSEGRFGFHDFTDYIPPMLRAVGRRAHVVAVCQPGPPVLAAVSLMAEDGDPMRPASMTFMGSPIDARLSPTVTNQLAEERPFAWFQSNMIYTVPFPYLGAARRVYPGFVQLYSFMSMNEREHTDAHRRYFEKLVEGDGESVERHRVFYDEYLSVLDLTEEFYLETIGVVFQKHLLPRGELVHNGRLVKPAAIKDIGLMTVEGTNDDISGVGQTQAAHVLCTGLEDAQRELYVHPTVGHYGVFNGRHFREDIYPRVRDFVARHETL